MTLVITRVHELQNCCNAAKDRRQLTKMHANCLRLLLRLIFRVGKSLLVKRTNELRMIWEFYKIIFIAS